MTIEQMRLWSDGKTCPYCDQPSVYVDSKEIYGKSYGMIWLCRPCRAYVGVHDGKSGGPTGKPRKALGRLAQGALRQAKGRAHSAFDSLWRNKMMGRQEAYKWLSEKLELPSELCHIGMMDEALCERTCAAVSEYMADVRQARRL